MINSITNFLLILCFALALTSVPVKKAQAEVVFTVVTLGNYFLALSNGDSITGECFDAVDDNPFVLPLCPLAFVLTEERAVLTSNSRERLAKLGGYSPTEIAQMEENLTLAMGQGDYKVEER